MASLQEMTGIFDVISLYDLLITLTPNADAILSPDIPQ